MDKDSPEFIKHIFECLETSTKTFTKWEEDFIESVKGQFEIKGRLSERQLEILEKIYAEKT